MFSTPTNKIQRTVYPIIVWKCAELETALYHRREPFLGVPESVPSTRDLTNSDNERAKGGLRGDRRQNLFGDPFRFAITISNSEVWLNGLLENLSQGRRRI